MQLVVLYFLAQISSYTAAGIWTATAQSILIPISGQEEWPMHFLTGNNQIHNDFRYPKVQV